MVQKVVTNFDSPKAYGPDCISAVEEIWAWTLIHTAELFNKCWKESCFPDCSKVSSVIPVFKIIGKSSIAKCYHLVSLLSVVSKIFEKLVNSRIIDHFAQIWPFFWFPVWFQVLLSAPYLLVLVSDRIARAHNSSGATRAVALDIFKAFGKVSESGLLHKLKSCWIPALTFGAVSSFLSNRQLWVILDGTFLKSIHLMGEFFKALFFVL